MHSSAYKNIHAESPLVLPSGIHFHHYCLDESNKKRIQAFLDTLFDPHQSFSTTIEKHLTTIKSYISGGQSFEDFLHKYNNSVLCGFLWTNAAVSYRCRTCATNPCMSLCPNCFHNGNHQEHDASMFQSIGGGICDCGDITVMNPNSFCKHHGPSRLPNAPIPQSLIRCAQIVLPRLILRLIQYLRSHATPIKSNPYSTMVDFDSLASLFDLIDDLNNAGSSIRSIFTDCLLNSDFYEQFNTQSSFNDLPNIAYDVYLQQLNAATSLLIPISLRTDNSLAYFHIRKATCLLDEIFFWLTQYQIPERLLKFVLMLLTDFNFKRSCIQSFLNIYGMSIDRWTHCRNSRDRINRSRIAQISVQLFSNTDIIIQAIKEYYLMELMLSSLYFIFSNILTCCQLQEPKENYHLVVFEIEFSKNMHYWPIISDFINVLSHENASREFLSEKRFFITWIKIISWFQGMNVNHHGAESELLLQSNTNYLFAFTIETECCALVLWTFLAHLMKPDFLEMTTSLVNYLFLEVRQWLSSIGVEQYKDVVKNQVTFHIPLHRYISILNYVSLNYQDGELKNLFPIENEIFLLNLAVFPLRIQVAKYEIMTNTIWSYQSYEMQMQSDMHCSARGNNCSYMNDADIFLLQLISTLVNMNVFMEMFFKSFYVPEWLIQNTENNLMFEKSSYVTLLEGSLIVLASIVAFSPNLELNDYEHRRTELINALAIQDCHYSYLDERIAEPKGFSTAKHDIQSIVDDIAKYIPPTIDITNEPKQGQYKLKDFLWEDEFDPLHVLLRISRRDLFETTMQRYTQWVKLMNTFSYETNIWPPYRLHKPKDQFQTNLRCILQSRYLHGIFFSICHWMMNETMIHEDILSLLVYLCELAIDDLIRRFKYGEYLNGYAPSATEPPQCQNILGISHSVSLETLTSLEDDNVESNSFKLNLSKDNEKVCATIETSNPSHVAKRTSKINSCRVTNKTEFLNKIEQCYARRAIKFNQISEHEQKIQKKWDELMMTKDSSVSNEMFYSMPSYDLENQFIRSDSHLNNHITEEQEDKTRAFITKKKIKIKGIVDGKYETFYDQDNLLINAHTVIENISFEHVVVDFENDTTESVCKEESNKEDSCTNTHLDQPSVNLNTISIQTKSKYITETKCINMSLVQMLVHLLFKIILNINDLNSSNVSLSDLLDKTRRKKGSQRIGDGTVYLSRLLMKFEQLCDECRVQINETISQLDQSQSNNNVDHVTKKTNAKAIHTKIFADIATKQQQQQLLTTSNDENKEDEKMFSLTNDNNVECCICQSKEDRNSLGLVIRLIDTGVLGVREVDETADNYLPLSTSDSSADESSLKDFSTCCHLYTNDKDQLSPINRKHNLTCAQVYEDKIRSMVKIFSEKKFNLNNEFKCPVCLQTSNAFLYIPLITKPIELNGNFMDSITNLIEADVTPLKMSSSITEWFIDFIQKIYMMVNKNERIINTRENQLDNNILELVIVSLLRFNLENDLLVRDTKSMIPTILNRKSCFRELFYICSLQYIYLLNDSVSALWHRITSLSDMKLENIDLDKTTSVPLFLSDPVALLLRIMLSLSNPITKESYQIIVQAIFNLVYIQALFTIVSEMNRTEQESWSQIEKNKSKNNMIKYLSTVSSKLLQANYNSNTDNSKVWSLESINASIRERCGNFIKIAALIQHHLYQPITWWTPGCVFQFDLLWKNLIQELQVYNDGEPHWFRNDSLSSITNWLNEVFQIDKQHLKLLRHIARGIPLFHSPRFIHLPTCYADLLQSNLGRQCFYCRKSIIQPILCLICGIVHSKEDTEKKCCHQHILSIKEHLISCNDGLNLSINIHSTETLIQRKQRYNYWSSLYLDKYGEEDIHLRRGRILYLNEDRLKLLYSAWISSNLDQLSNTSSIDEFDF
ncbi:unnamed protein product [Rotaria magnacalcarata]